jgi:translation initiation factor 5A
VLIQKNPCKIISIVKSASGKHGHVKISITGIDVFTGKYEGGGPASHVFPVPFVKRTSCMVLDIDDEGYLSLMDVERGCKEDMKVLETKVGEKLRNLFEEGKGLNVVVSAAMTMQLLTECAEN